MCVLLLGNCEFLGKGLKFVSELIVDQVQFLFLVTDEAFLDFHLLDDFKVLVFEDVDTVFKGHIFIDNFSIFFPDEGDFLASEFQFFEFGVHEFDPIIFFSDLEIFFFHFREQQIIFTVESFNLKIDINLPFLFGALIFEGTLFQFRFHKKNFLSLGE